MFGFKKSSDELDETVGELPSAPPPLPAPAVAPKPAPLPAAKAPTPAKRCTEIAADTQIHGHVRSGSGINVAGEISGNVHAESSVVIEASARVQGDVCGDDVIVRGRVEGQVVAKGKLTISATGLVLGDIVVRSLLIEDGGTLQGQCRMGATASADAQASSSRLAALPEDDDDETIDSFLPEMAAAGS